jgi:peptide/nickel transport system substrate-binding protein
MSDNFARAAEARISRRGLLVGTGAVSLASLLFPKVGWSAPGGILRVRSYADLQVLDPAFRLAAPEDDIMACIFAQMVTAKPGDEWAWMPGAVDSIEQLDPLTIAFKLKDQLGFTDGYGQVTADDVKFSIERFADPAMESPYAGDWATLKEVEVKDTLSGLIHLKEAFAPLWNSTLPTAASMIVSRKAVTELGGKIATAPVAMSGPYVLKEWLPKQKTVLVRNPDWKYQPGAYDEVHISPIEDEKTAELGYEAGDLDYTWTAVSSVARLKATPPAETTVVEKPSLAFVWLGMNKDVAPFDNPNIRRAVQYAIDTKAVVDAAYYGAAAVATGIIAPGLPGHRDAVLYEYNPDKARELLAAENVSGLTITLDILNKTERLTAAQVVQANLADVGITVEIKQNDSGTFWTLGAKEGDYWNKLQMILSRFSMNPDPSWATAWFTTDQVGVWNWERFSDAEFDKLNSEGVLELDPSKRDVIYKRMQDIMEESGCYVFLTHEVVGVMHRNSVVPALKPNGTPMFVGFSAT